MNPHAEKSKIFLDIAQFVIELEGGYVHDPADPGGETKFGISQRAYPDVDIAGITFDAAVDIYYADYWFPARCHELPPGLAAFVFDSHVNHGLRPAIRLLQNALGVDADGLIGPLSLKAAHRADSAAALIDALSHRARYYHLITVNRETNSRFIRGWFRRLFLLQQYISNFLLTRR